MSTLFVMIIYKTANCYILLFELLVIEPKALMQSKMTDSVFDYIEIWFTDQYNNPLQTEDSVNTA